MANRYWVLFTILFLAVSAASAQRGLPPKKRTSSKLVTHYPQHLDFLPEMVKILKVPKGWTVQVAASGLGKPRMMRMGADGALYITRRDGGDVLMLKDKDGDHKFEELTTVAAEFKGVHGITLKNGWMYLCNNNELRRYRLQPDGTLSKEWETLINNLPSGRQHPNRTIDFGPDGK